MNKFKVGDIVVGNEFASDNYSITVKGWEGVVTRIRDNSFAAAAIRYIGNDDIEDMSYGGLRYDCFDLKTPKNPLVSKLEGL